MTYPVSSNNYAIAVGSSSTSPFINIILDRAPTGNDGPNQGYQVGKRWIDTSSGNTEWFLLGYTSSGGVVQANWVQIAGGSAMVETLTGNSGGAVSPTGDNINVVGDGTTVQVVGNPGTSTLTISTISSGAPVTSVNGTVNQIDVVPTTGDVVVSIDTAYPGQTSIITLGTVTTGTWDGSVILGQYGGTGVANTGLTINLGAATTGYVLTSDSSGNATWQVNSGGGIVQTTGTWVPTVTGGTTAGTTTYNQQSGTWVRTGNMIHIEADIAISAATGTGDAIFSLPFTIAATSAASSGVGLPIGGIGGSWTWGTGQTTTALAGASSTKTAVIFCNGNGTITTNLQMQNTASFFALELDYLTSDP